MELKAKLDKLIAMMQAEVADAKAHGTDEMTAEYIAGMEHMVRMVEDVTKGSR